MAAVEKMDRPEDLEEITKESSPTKPLEFPEESDFLTAENADQPELELKTETQQISPALKYLENAHFQEGVLSELEIFLVICAFGIKEFWEKDKKLRKNAVRVGGGLLAVLVLWFAVSSKINEGKDPTHKWGNDPFNRSSFFDPAFDSSLNITLKTPQPAFLPTFDASARGETPSVPQSLSDLKFHVQPGDTIWNLCEKALAGQNGMSNMKYYQYQSFETMVANFCVEPIRLKYFWRDINKIWPKDVFTTSK